MPERLVDRYSAALRAQKPLGASFELAIAPDSNINRATRSDTLGTVLGDFTLNQDAQARSGVGLALRGQVYGRLCATDQGTINGCATNSQPPRDLSGPHAVFSKLPYFSNGDRWLAAFVNPRRLRLRDALHLTFAPD